VFKALRSWINDEPDASSESEIAKAAADAERRLDTRHNFAGYRVGIRDRRVQSFIGLKDMSCRGACGISEMPLSVGSIIFIEIRKKRFHAAQVRWVRNALVGLQFFRPLQPEMVEKFHAGCMAKKPKSRR
jgi:hypothetical protein